MTEEKNIDKMWEDLKKDINRLYDENFYLKIAIVILTILIIVLLFLGDWNKVI